MIRTLSAKRKKALREIPRDVRLYRSLKALSARQVPGGISLRNAMGPSFDIVFRQMGEETEGGSDIVIPYFFTKRGFHDFFVPKSQDLSVIAVEDAWVTGERKRIRYSDEDLQAFMEKIRHAYTTDYINFWNNAIGSLEIVRFRNVDDAARVFSEINGPANPFGRVLNLVKAETEIYSAAPAKTDEEQPKTEIAFDRNREYGLRIARAFSDLSALVMAKEGQTQPLEELMKTTANMELYFKSIQTGQQSSKPVALEKAQGRAKLQGDDPIFVLRRTGSNLPKPFDSYFRQLADHSWKVILDAARIDLQSVWQTTVYRTFNVDLAGRYPFNINSREEVSLREFQRFFGVDGEFDHFFNDYLKTFINPNTGQPVVIDGQSLSVSNEFIKQVTTVRNVRDIFFNADGVPTLRYTVEPVSMSGNISRSVLNIEGQLVPYSHGPSRPISILWSNALSSKQDISQITTSKGGGSGSVTYTGLWSSFRLFDQSEIAAVSPDSAELVFSVDGGQIKYRVRMSATEKKPVCAAAADAVEITRAVIMSQTLKTDMLTGIAWIDSSPLFLAVAGAAVGNETGGESSALEDHEVFEEIETEMMKRGTLAHATIRWEWVCAQCALLLQTQAKDFRLLLYMLLSLPHLKDCPAPLTFGGVLTAAFIRRWGEAATPAGRRRTAAARKIVDALAGLAGHAAKYGVAPELVGLTGDALRQLPDFFADISPDLRESLLALPRQVEDATAVEQAAAPLAAVKNGQSAESYPLQAAGQGVPAAVRGEATNAALQQTLPETVHLDPRNERGLKQSLAAIADFILALDASNPLSYRLRRFATWYGVSAPPLKKDEKTVIQPVSENAADSYRQAAARGQADLEIVHKLEKSCHVQPFWIEGQYLACQLASAGGREKAADAIAEETDNFILLHDWFFRLQFSDGTPFITENVCEWLAKARQKKTVPQGSAAPEHADLNNDMQEFVLEVRKKAKNGQMQEAMEMLENSRYAQQSPRETALWELLVMECLNDWGLKQLVSMQARRLETEITGKTVADWEPDLIKRARRLTTSR